MNNRFKGVFKDTPTYIDVSTGYFQEIKGTIYYTEAFVNCLKQENQQLKKTIDKALTLLQLIQMNDEVDWGDINTLINILKESDVK